MESLSSLKDAVFPSQVSFLTLGPMKPIKQKYKIDFGGLKYFHLTAALCKDDRLIILDSLSIH